MKKTPQIDYNENETEKRRDNALRRALSTPPKPKKSNPIKNPKKKNDS